MRLWRGLLRQIMKPAAVAVLAMACVGASTVVLAETDSIAIKELPRDSRLAIWGDSITEVTLYPRFVEMYLLACAGRKDVKVCTFGHSGETLAGLLGRQSDLEAFKPTVVSFNYGMNDTQYSPYTAEKGAAYDKTMHAVLAMLADRGIKFRIAAGPDAVDDLYGRENPAAFFGKADPGGLTAAQAQNVTLRHFRDFGRAAAVETGSAYADLHNRLLDSYNLAKKDLGPTYGIGVHPTPNGHLLIAYELLKTLACDGDIGTINVDMKGKANATAGHAVVTSAGGTVVLDSSKYPFCYNYDPYHSNDPTSVASIVPYVPFGQDLNRLILKVTNLDAASASVTWGSQTKSFTREQLAKGINLTEHFAHTPFDTTFARVIEAIGNKQDFENFMIKGTSNYFGNDAGGNFDAHMIAVQQQKDAAVKALLVPVRHTIAIVPDKASETTPPVITGTMMAYATVGQAFSIQVSSIHAPTAFAADFPAGLKINASTGEITGTPAATGTYAIALTATNASGSGTATLKLVVSPSLPERPAVTSPTTASATVGKPFSYQIAATNNPTHFFVSCPSDKGVVPPASSLPPGLTYDTTTGVLSGTPKTAGSCRIQVAAMNEAGVTAQFVTLTIAGE